MVETLSFTIEGSTGGRTWPIVGDVYLPAAESFAAPAASVAPVVAIAHGWLGHKDRAFLPEIARGLAGAGLVAVTFNFSGSGVAAGADEIAEQDERFAANTFGREVEDLERVVTAIFERILPGRERFDIYEIGVLGYDTGGAVALIEAARDSRVKAVVALAAPLSLGEVLPKAAWDDWIARGEHAFRDPRTGRLLTIGREMFRDLNARRSTGPGGAAAEPVPGVPPADTLPAVRALGVPFLVIHGEQDERFPPADARKLYFASTDGRVELEMLTGVDHDLVRVGAGDAPATPLASAAAIRFFQKRLR